MNKTELIVAIAERAGIEKRQADAALQAFGEVLAETLAKGEKLQWTGIGTFELRQRAARKGRNPATGEEIDIAASVAPAFKSGKTLRQAVGAAEEE